MGWRFEGNAGPHSSEPDFIQALFVPHFYFSGVKKVKYCWTHQSWKLWWEIESLLITLEEHSGFRTPSLLYILALCPRRETDEHGRGATFCSFGVWEWGGSWHWGWRQTSALLSGSLQPSVIMCGVALHANVHYKTPSVRDQTIFVRKRIRPRLGMADLKQMLSGWEGGFSKMIISWIITQGLFISSPLLGDNKRTKLLIGELQLLEKNYKPCTGRPATEVLPCFCEQHYRWSAFNTHIINVSLRINCFSLRSYSEVLLHSCLERGKY